MYNLIGFVLTTYFNDKYLATILIFEKILFSGIWQ